MWFPALISFILGGCLLYRQLTDIKFRHWSLWIYIGLCFFIGAMFLYLEINGTDLIMSGVPMA
ncbi:hypothetical protein DT351_11305 (plasmid) [Latilactobacillus curvatus]|uniref:Uncharacterized protein n=1 Tax=Latilactobacillus curvatus TaxID=28038 RepID=A0A385AGV2_LATCU|nr:hypothetical protein [Latilactobacillus curvatus]AXN36925.1 hypothetical protein DT351_11305 [Latilactobacillus curvatus]